MLQSIFYKEWFKTRKIMFLCLFVSIGFVIYALMRIGRVVELRGVAHLWEIMLMKDTVFIDILRFVPLVMGVLAAISQFVPEMQQKRLKLTLHLPYSRHKILFAMLAYGLLCLAAVFLVNFILLWFYVRQVVAVEFVSRILLTAAVWYIAGIAGYALVAWICLEPAWKRRIANTLFAAAFIRLMFLNTYPEAYNGSLWWLMLLSVIFTGFATLSVSRFKAGVQD